ncbi:MAG: DEAD/DEAH box helicase [Campylobacterota bacterium]|nr:DEAD/DEAH box helicase [Campylobacterota bacterium]
MSEEKRTTSKKYYDHISVANRTSQVAYFVQQHDKSTMLQELLKPLGSKQILLLVKSKKGADTLNTSLKELGLNSICAHGNHRASQIEEAVVAFNAKEANIIITTDRIFETMDLGDVDLLINYDLPLEEADYFKRLRKVDEVGESIVLIDPDEERTLATLELMMKCEMKEEELEGFEHTNSKQTSPKDKTKKPRHKKVAQRAKRKAEIKSQWVPVEKQEEEKK